MDIDKIIEFWTNKTFRFNEPDDVPALPVVNIDIWQSIIVPKLIEGGAIPKKDLIAGETYIGECRNATEAIWNGEQFVYKRTKFGTTFDESINHFEDDNGFDLFVPIRKK